jgi:hypothetical protein
MRLDPRILYLLEVAARKERRTSTSIVEAAIENALSQTVARVDVKEVDHRTPSEVMVDSVRKRETAPLRYEKKHYFYDPDVVEQLWHSQEPDRIIQLALFDPRLLSPEGQEIWELVRECPLFWTHEEGKPVRPSLDTLKREVLRQKWDDIKAVALDDKPEFILYQG